MVNCVNDNTRSYVQKKYDHHGDFLPETDFHDNVDDDPSDESDETDDTTEYQLKQGTKLVKRKKAKKYLIRCVRFNKENDPENYCREQLMLYTP